MGLKLASIGLTSISTPGVHLKSVGIGFQLISGLLLALLFPSVLNGYINPAYPELYAPDNPLYAATLLYPEFSIYTSDTETELMLNSRGLSIAYSTRNKNWKLSSGIYIKNKFALGLGCKFTSRFGYIDYRWGLLLRPTRFLSIGVASYPKGDDYYYGLALRPTGELLTIFGELHTEELEFNDKPDYNIGLELKPFDYLGLIASYSAGSGFCWGLRVKLDRLELLGNIGENNYYQTLARFSSRLLAPPLKRDSVYMLRLNNAVIERKRSILDEGIPLYSLLNRIDNLAESKTYSALLVDLSSFEASFAQAEELREALLRYKRSGKKLYIYLPRGGNVTYWLASCADSIFMPPGGSLYIYGLRLESIHLKGLLEKLGIRAEFVSIGKYKSAVEIFTREDMSDESREENRELLEDIYDELIQNIATARGLEPESVATLVDVGLFSADRAREAGLIDSVLHLSELTSKMKLDTRYREVSKSLWSSRPRLAILYATGAITAGESNFPIFDESNIEASAFTREIDKLKRDKAVKGVVLRINSPGGSALQSEIILNSLRELAMKKPLVISMGGISASGGYYISLVKDATLFADSSTITGSIGVISGKFALTGLYDKVGISIDTVQIGETAAIFSLADTLTDKNREKLERGAREYYELFLDRVVEARGLDRVEAEELAEGRIYTGLKAFELGLVDTLGGLSDALNYLEEVVGLERGEYELIQLPRAKSIAESIAELLDVRFPFESYEVLYLAPYIKVR